jgi:hypothetical protein
MAARIYPGTHWDFVIKHATADSLLYIIKLDTTRGVKISRIEYTDAETYTVYGLLWTTTRLIPVQSIHNITWSKPAQCTKAYFTNRKFFDVTTFTKRSINLMLKRRPFADDINYVKVETDPGKKKVTITGVEAFAIVQHIAVDDSIKNRRWDIESIRHLLTYFISKYTITNNTTNDIKCFKSWVYANNLHIDGFVGKQSARYWGECKTAFQYAWFNQMRENEVDDSKDTDDNECYIEGIDGIDDLDNSDDIILDGIPNEDAYDEKYLHDY